ERALEPLVRGGLGHERTEMRQEPRERARPLGAHGIALVGHGRAADLPGQERFAHLAGVSEEAAVLAELGEARADPRERVGEPGVELARVGLARERDGAREAELLRDERVE